MYVYTQAFYFLHKVMYAKRCRMDPFWASVLIGGYDIRCGLDLPVVDELDRKPEPFLGVCVYVCVYVCEEIFRWGWLIRARSPQLLLTPIPEQGFADRLEAA
jgi:hypothetical protein